MIIRLIGIALATAAVTFFGVCMIIGRNDDSEPMDEYWDMDDLPMRGDR